MSLFNKRYRILRKNGRYKHSFTSQDTTAFIYIHFTSQNTIIFIHITDIAYEHIQMSTVEKETETPVAPVPTKTVVQPRS